MSNEVLLSWSHVSTRTTVGNDLIFFFESILKPRRQRKGEKKQEVVDDLSVCVLMLLPEIDILPSFVAVSIAKWTYKFLKLPLDLMLVTWWSLKAGASHSKSPPYQVLQLLLKVLHHLIGISVDTVGLVYHVILQPT